ncbi:MAG: MarR family transcriptional regulator [Streptosporangiales bacterium]|jgi:DNA-binding MarR family transcriptional regulator|nr:MarR family transcriptional regulator [Streptosporangiales bacterium]
MAAVLRLNVSWLGGGPRHLGDLSVVQGDDDVLTYDDGITLQVILLDPAVYASVEELASAARRADRPGRAVLAAGAVPVSWRSTLRKSEISFMDVGGVAEIVWPRIRVSAGQFTGQTIVRRRTPVPLQKGHALVAQELVIAGSEGERLAVTELASRARVSVSTVSRAAARLAEHGLVERRQDRRQIRVEVTDLAALAELLAERTKWPGSESIGGYVWGRTIWDAVALISRNAAQGGIAASVTGRAGAAFLGVFGTSPPAEARFWVTLDESSSLVEIAATLGLEPAPRESANIRLSADPWRVGTSRGEAGIFDGLTATVAHPVRVWCDLRGEQRGVDFAAQLWGSVSNARESGAGRRL